MASNHGARAKGDDATHSPRSWETKESRKRLAPLKRASVMLDPRTVSRGKGITSATQEKRGYGVGLAVGTKKRTKGWTPNPYAIQHLCKPIGQHSNTLNPLKTLAYTCNQRRK